MTGIMGRLSLRTVADSVLYFFPGDPVPGAEWESDILHARKWAESVVSGGDPSAEDTRTVARFTSEYWDGVEMPGDEGYLMSVLYRWACERVNEGTGL